MVHWNTREKTVKREALVINFDVTENDVISTVQNSATDFEADTSSSDVKFKQN